MYKDLYHTGTEQTIAQMMPGAAPTKHTMVHRCRQSDWFGDSCYRESSGTSYFVLREGAPVYRVCY